MKFATKSIKSVLGLSGAALLVTLAYQPLPAGAADVDVNINGGRYIPRDTQYGYKFHYNQNAKPAESSEDLNALFAEVPTAAGESNVNLNSGQFIPRDTQYPNRKSYTTNTEPLTSHQIRLQQMLKENPTAAGSRDSNVQGGAVIPRDSNYIWKYYQNRSNNAPMGPDSSN